MDRIRESLSLVKRAKALGDYDVNVIGMAAEIIAEDEFGMVKARVGQKTIDGRWKDSDRSVQVKGWSDSRVRRYRGGTFLRIPAEDGPDDLVVIVFFAAEEDFQILYHGDARKIGRIEKNGRSKVVRLDHMLSTDKLAKLLSRLDSLDGR